jgi:branched-chain amino acid transport system substrate-binding protein
VTTFGVKPPKAFVSWAHSDDAWRDTIARFVVALREFGIDADVDLFHTHDGAVDWSTYGPNAIKENDFVLIAASAAYKERWEGPRTTRTGAGAAREANVLKALFDEDQAAFFKKVIVVVLPGARDADIPSELVAGLPRFVIPEIDKRHLEDLLRRLTGQPAFVPAPPGQVPILPPEIGGPVSAPKASGARAANDEVASNLKQRLEELDKNIAVTPGGADDARNDEKAERSALLAALKAITKRSQGNPQLPPRWRLPVVAGAVVLALGAVVVIPGGGSPPPPPVKVGAIYSLSGVGGETGKEALEGARFAVEYINGGNDPESTLPLKAGRGLPRLDSAKLKLVPADVGSDRCETQPAFNQLVNGAGVVAVVGAYESTITLQALIAANKRQVPLVNESATAPGLTELDSATRASVTACGADRDPRPSPWFFRVGPSDTRAAEEFFTFIEEAERNGTIRSVRRVAILHENDDMYGSGGAAITKKIAQRRRGVVVRRFPYHSVLGPSAPRSACTVKKRTLTQLRLRVQQMKQYRPDVVFAFSYRPDAIAAFQMMQKLGYVPPALLAYGAGFASRTFNSSVKAGNLACHLPRADPSGIVSRVAWSSDSGSQSPMAQRIAQLFRQRFKRTMTPTAASGFTAMMTLAQAIDDAGSPDPTKIREALKKLMVPGDETIMPWTGVKFNHDGQNTRARFVLQQTIRGSYHVVFPGDVLTTANPIWPLDKAR